MTKEIKKAKCNECGFEGTPEEFNASFSAYHDLKCSKCGTTNIDTTNVDYEGYGYGDNNCLKI